MHFFFCFIFRLVGLSKIVVFRFTIGGLLNNHLTLPLLLEKTTLCWEVMTIMILEFYLISVTMHNFEQSAGNLPIISNNININAMVLGYNTWGSSEIICSPRNKLLWEDIVHVKKYSLIRPLSLHFKKWTFFWKKKGASLGREIIGQ